MWPWQPQHFQEFIESLLYNTHIYNLMKTYMYIKLFFIQGGL